MLLAPRKIRKRAISPVIRREIGGVDATVEESYKSAIKVRLGPKRASKMVKLMRRGQDYCRFIRRIFLRKERKLKSLGLRATQLTWRTTSCSLNYNEEIARLPNDPYLQPHIPYMWGLIGTYGAQMSAAWDMNTGSHDVVIAVIDTGIETTHPELVPNLWTNPDEIPNNGIDDDHNGYSDDIHGINTITNSGTLSDGHGHGTHVAGTIGASGDNGSWISGINWNVTMIGCKFLSDAGSGNTADAIECVDYITDLKLTKGLNIIASNNSWGGGAYSSALAAAITNARAAGIVFVAAAGNKSTDIDASPYYPARYPGALAVGALDEDGNLASFSNYGDQSVKIAAPGDGILSTYKGHTYAYMSGTSMAAPHVTGLLALMASTAPGLSPNDLENYLLTTAGSLSSLNGTINYSRTLRADSAILAVNSLSSDPDPTPTPTASPTPDPTPDPAITPTPTPTLEPTPSPTVEPQPKKKKKKQLEKRKKNKKEKKKEKKKKKAKKKTKAKRKTLS